MPSYERSIASSVDPDELPFHEGTMHTVDGLTATDSVPMTDDASVQYRDITERHTSPRRDVFIGYFWRANGTDEPWEWHGFLV